MIINDKVTIITGASQGIGLATAKQLSGLGAKVVLVARSEEKIEKLEKELSGSLSVVADIRIVADILKMVKETMAHYGRIDILINNAAQGTYGLVEKIDIENYKQIMELNVYAVLSTMQEVIPYMREQGGGMIINVSSGVAKGNVSGVGAYSSTKAALNSLTLTAREELKKDNIVVSIIEPRMTSTGFGDNAIGGRPEWIGKGASKAYEQPLVDSPEKVAEKISELIDSEVAVLEVI